MSEYDDWKQENDRWEAYLYPNGVYSPRTRR